jgi:hypothetical protein
MDHQMRSIRKLAITTALCVLLPSAVLAQPVLAGKDANRDECRRTYALAGAKFHSRDYSLNGPIKPAKDGTVHFALQVLEDDISGGDALRADPAYFRDDASEKGGPPVRHIFWEIKPRAAKRLVVLVHPFNWKGDLYSAYALDTGVTSGELKADLSRANSEKRFKPVIDESWTPPQVLVDLESGNNWLLMQGSQYYALSEWTVYGPGGDGLAELCTVRFMPKVKEAVHLLPRPAERFAALLSEILGPGNDEGTLQPTARIRASVESTWGNIILRPWALQSPPYNNRADVDAGLEHWAAVNAKRRVVYRDMMRLYPRAEAALAAHYRARFRLSPGKATVMARYATDMVFRAYFVFPSGAGFAERVKAAKKPPANPWPVSAPSSP